MKSKNYHMEKSQKEAKWYTNTRPITFLALYRHFNKRWRGLTSFMGSKLPLLVTWCGDARAFHVRVKCQPSDITGRTTLLYRML
jgi:hypothetical protein